MSDDFLPGMKDRDNIYSEPDQDALPGLEEWTHKAVVEHRAAEERKRAPARVPTQVAKRASARSLKRARVKQSSRGFKMLEFFLVGIAVMVGLLIFAVAILLMRPSGSSNLFVDLNQNLKATLGPSYSTAISAVGGTFGRARDGYDVRVKPTVTKVGEFLGVESEESGRTGPAASADAKLFTKCVECHDLFEYRSALSGIYIDHGVHGIPWLEKSINEGHDEAESEGESGGHEGDVNPEIAKITCGRCHRDAGIHIQDNTDVDSVAVTEVACYSCHKEWDQRGKGKTSIATCRKCHAPGWYFDKAFVSQEKTDRFLRNREVHKRSLDNRTFTSPSLTGPKRKFCMNCHRRFGFCNDCHQVLQGSHKDRTRFVATHGPKLIVTREWAMTDCWACHNGNWCVRKCHINGKKGPGVPKTRSLGRYPIPWKSLKLDD